MPDEELLDELLTVWQRDAEQGLNVTAADLCRDPELAQELERRIAVLRKTNGLHKDAYQTLSCANLDSQPDSYPPPRQAAPVVPGYEMLDELGRGGMGVVYKARQVKLGRVVALKMILAGRPCRHSRPGPLPHRGRGRRPLAASQHRADPRDRRARGPAVLLPGVLRRRQSWTKKLGRHARCRPRRRPRCVETLARAMQAAHEQGVIHRDLKPANVLLTEDGTPKITDFGLAKKLDEAGQTQTGAVMGTPPYMAPEQAGGGMEPTGPAADVYALGAILYECLTGRPPFKAATTLDTIMQVLSRRAGAAAAVAAADAARPGDDLPEVPAEGAGQALCLGAGPGGRPATLPGGRADLGAAGGAGRAGLALVPAESSRGGVTACRGHGSGSRQRGFSRLRASCRRARAN